MGCIESLIIIMLSTSSSKSFLLNFTLNQQGLKLLVVFILLHRYINSSVGYNHGYNSSY